MAVTTLPFFPAFYLKIFKHIPAEKISHPAPSPASEASGLCDPQTHHQSLHKHFGAHPQSSFSETSSHPFQSVIIQAVCRVPSALRSRLIRLVFLQFD